MTDFKTKVRIIFACGTNGAFGNKNKLPWKTIKEDLQKFKERTQGGCVIMGYNTWESLPAKPLPDRLNVVITRKKNPPNQKGVVFCKSLEKAIWFANSMKVEDTWIIGGAGIIEQAFEIAEAAIVTKIVFNGEFDVRAPKLDSSWILQHELHPEVCDDNNPFWFEFYSRKKKAA